MKLEARFWIIQTPPSSFNYQLLSSDLKLLLGISLSKGQALSACKYAVSGSISLPSRGSFQRSLAVLVHYRSIEVFSLRPWPA